MGLLHVEFTRTVDNCLDRYNVAARRQARSTRKFGAIGAAL